MKFLQCNMLTVIVSRVFILLKNYEKSSAEVSLTRPNKVAFRMFIIKQRVMTDISTKCQ